MINPRHLGFLILLRDGQNSIITDGQFSVDILTVQPDGDGPGGMARGVEAVECLTAEGEDPLPPP